MSQMSGYIKGDLKNKVAGFEVIKEKKHADYQVLVKRDGKYYYAREAYIQPDGSILEGCKDYCESECSRYRKGNCRYGGKGTRSIETHIFYPTSPPES